MNRRELILKKSGVFLVALTLIVSMLAGCGGQQSSTADSKNKIIYAMSDEAETLDPTLNIYARSSNVLLNLFSGLFKVGPDGKLAPSMAESYTIDETGTKYTFKIRDNAKWSDGKPLTAQDFEYTFKRILNPDVASKAAYELYYIKNGKAYNDGNATADEVGVKALDDRTLEITLENPTPYFLDLLSSSSYLPVRKDIVEGNEGWTKSPETLISNGPFYMAEIKPKEKYVLKKNPHYVDADKVKLDTLEITFIDSPETELAAYQNNEIDISQNLTPEGMSQYKDSSEFHRVPRIGVYYLDINTSKDPFDDARVRKAFSISINREQLVTKILQTVGKPAFGFVPYGIPHGVEKDKDYRDVVGNLFTEDVSEAKKLLAEAGYPDGKDFPTVTYICMADQANKDLAQALQSMWKENLGVQVDIRTYESKLYWDEMHQGNFNIGWDGWTGDYLDPMTMLDQMESVNTETNNRWSNPEYDRLLEENRKTADQKIRMENFAKAEKLLMDEMPIIPLYFRETAYLCKPNIKGLLVDVSGHMIFEYAYKE